MNIQKLKFVQKPRPWLRSVLVLTSGADCSAFSSLPAGSCSTELEALSPLPLPGYLVLALECSNNVHIFRHTSVKPEDANTGNDQSLSDHYSRCSPGLVLEGTGYISVSTLSPGRVPAHLGRGHTEAVQSSPGRSVSWGWKGPNSPSGKGSRRERRRKTLEGTGLLHLYM